MDSGVASYHSAILLLNVCLLLGCWQFFYSHSKPFMLISHMDTLNLKKSCVKRLEKRVLFLNILVSLLSICGYLQVRPWIPVGIASPLNEGKECPVVLWDVHSSFKAGRELLLRCSFAGWKRECCWALAEITFLNVSQPERAISQVLQKSSNGPLCHVCRTNDYPAERRGFNFSCCILFPGRIWGRQVTEPYEPAYRVRELL